MIMQRIASILLAISALFAARLVRAETVAETTAAGIKTANTLSTAPLMNTAELFKFAGALLLVLVIFMVLARLMRRLNGVSAGGAGSLRVVSALSVGTRERVLVVQVGEKQVLLGVTATHITALHELEQPLDHASTSESSAPVGRGFKQALKKARETSS